jgi:hypothetical protein
MNRGVVAGRARALPLRNLELRKYLIESGVAMSRIAGPV